MFNLLIRNGRIIDGSGAAAFSADLAIQNDRIAAIGDLSAAEAAQVIDAGGLAVAPGFIDMHSHSDSSLPFLPTADSKVHQGVTLEVVGNCGSSLGPFSPAMVADFNESNRLAGQNIVMDWQSFGETLDRLKQQGVSLNVAPLVGHGSIRKAVMGMSGDAPTPAQLAQMQDEVRRAMDEGAIGLSTGLIYTPSVYAQTDEIVALARVAAEKGGLYASHIRGEGATLLEAVTEAVAIGRAAEIPVEISHLKAGGVENWPLMPRAIEIIQKARNEGLDVYADMYPYPASNTGLTSLIPTWMHVGGRDAFLARLTDPSIRARIHAELADPATHATLVGVPWADILISGAPGAPDAEGRNLQQVADDRKVHPVDAIMDILIDTHLDATIIMFEMKEENVALGLRQPWVCIGSDGYSLSTEKTFSPGKPHPRSFGAFPRVLGHYAREQKLFSLEEAVRKMTSLPASRLGLRERGLLKPGNFADVVIFDPATVTDTATFTHPLQYPAGIPWVIVNGAPVIADGRHTGSRPGVVVSL